MRRHVVSGLHTRSRGVALIFALLLLLVLTVLAVGTFSSVNMQERMASNANLQALAFEAASAGVAQAPVFGLDESNWLGPCQRGISGWQNTSPPDWGSAVWNPLVHPDLPEGLTVAFAQRVGCFEPDQPPADWDADYKVPVQLLVLTRGIVHRGDPNDPLATREIEVRVENRGVGDTQCAIRIEGGIDETQLRVANSNLGVDGGEGGCPVSVSSEAGADALKSAVEDAGRIGQYTPTEPGIHSPKDEGSAPWGNAALFADFMNNIKSAVLAYDDFEKRDRVSYLTELDWRDGLADRLAAAGEGSDEKSRLQSIVDFVDDKTSGGWSINNCKSRFYEGSTKISNANIPGGQCPINNQWPESGNEIEVRDSVDPDDPEFEPAFITYVAGHLGNPSNNSGSGILITEGGVCWSGTAKFDGLQIIAGGHFEIIGGGGAETTGGILMSRLQGRYGVLTDPDFELLRPSGDLRNKLPFPLDEGTAPSFGDSGFRFAGGGSHTITFKCSNENDTEAGPPGFKQYIDRLNQCLDPDVPIEPNCDPDATGLGLRQAIASWREFIDRGRWGED